MNNKFTITLITLLLLLGSDIRLSATTRYVDAARPDNNAGGTSWALAYKDLQVAINVVASGDTVLVKAGTYLPTLNANGAVPSDAREKSFYLINKNIALLGGFTGTEASVDQRDPFANPTILSGDLDGPGGTADCYHVLLTAGLTANANLTDGFVISGGKANSSFGSITVAGSLYFFHNRGGGVQSYSSSPTFTRCVIRNNLASWAGGGMQNYSCNPIFNNCVFTNNSAVIGGGMHNISCYAYMYNSIVCNNTATENGGGLYISDIQIRIYNSTIAGNTATGSSSQGAAIFYLNSGGALLNDILYNNTTPANASSGVKRETANGGITVNYCIVGDYGPGSGLGGGPVSNANPNFIDPANPAGADGLWGTADDGLRIPCSSPAKDNSDPSRFASYISPADLNGSSRNGVPDLGAYEAFGTVAVQSIFPATGSVPGNQTAGIVNYTDCNNQVATINATSPKTLVGQVTAKVFIQTTAPVYNGQKYVRRHYDITPAINRNTATATVTLYFTQADFDDYNTNNGANPDLPANANDNTGKANLKITQQHGISATGLPGTYSYSGTGPQNVVIDPVDANVFWSASASRWEVTFDVTGFSGFFAYGSNSASPLPLKLLSFTANKENDHRNQLTWITGAEDPGTVFDITRSTNGRNFETLGNVAGNGTSISYSYNDDQPLPGVNYYRLKMLESNGSSSYSNVAIVNSSKDGGSITISPVPANEIITVTNTDAALNGQLAHITDIQGRTIYQTTLSAKITIDVQGWPAGVYCLRLGNGYTVRFVKI